MLALDVRIFRPERGGYRSVMQYGTRQPGARSRPGRRATAQWSPQVARPRAAKREVVPYDCTEQASIIFVIYA